MMESHVPRLLHRSDTSILALDRPWEDGTYLSAVAVMPEPGGDELRLYYLVLNRSDPLRNVLCLARSRDGLNWTKPDLGDGSNVVMRATGNTTEWGAFMPKTIVHDPREPDARLHWKMIYWDRPDPRLPAGICLAASPDGIHWQPCHDHPVIINANDAGSVALVNPAAQPGPRPGPVFLYQQTWKYNPGLPVERDNLKFMHRVISIWTCDSFAGRWVGPTLILEPDEKDAPDLQFYWMSVYATRTGYGGLVNCHHTGNQTMDVQLVSSRDGWTWQRELDRRPLLSLGGPGRFDCGMVFAVAKPLLWQGRALLFFNARSSVHDHRPRHPDGPRADPANGIGLATFTPELLQIGEPDAPANQRQAKE